MIFFVDLAQLRLMLVTQLLNYLLTFILLILHRCFDNFKLPLCLVISFSHLFELHCLGFDLEAEPSLNIFGDSHPEYVGIDW